MCPMIGDVYVYVFKPVYIGLYKIFKDEYVYVLWSAVILNVWVRVRYFLII